MLPERTGVTDEAVKALIANSVYQRYSSKPAWWIQQTANVNVPRLMCLYQGRCKKYIKGGKNRRCPRRKCYKPCAGLSA